MATERDKMLRSELYDPRDEELSAARLDARRLLKSFNDSAPDAIDLRRGIVEQLLGRAGRGLWIEPPFYCDYGSNITIGDNVYFNFNCVVLDPAAVTIGDHVLCGPGVQIYTPLHPIDAAERRDGLEYARPVTIEADVWVGGAAIVCPGVRIGTRSVIGAGSVVTRDIPAGVLAAGNPCRVIRTL